MKVKFLDLKKQYQSIKREIDGAIIDEIERCDYVLGNSLDSFEKDWARYCGVRYCVGVDSGTSALFLALKALGVKKDDEVITSANTFVSTVMAIQWCGAKPILVDCDETGLLDLNKIKRFVSEKTKAIISVHLYGQIVDVGKLKELVGNKIKIIEDAAQAHGSELKGKKAGSLGDAACFSFYPSKNLGCYGDGGVITMNDRELYLKLKSLRNYGSNKKYIYEKKGFNNRLDSLQARILSVKLKYLDGWNRKRNSIAKIYRKELESVKDIKLLNSEGFCNYYVMPIIMSKRDGLQKYLKESGVETLVHYPIPVHLQKAYKDLGYRKGDFPMTEKFCNQELSLPIYPEIKEDEVMYACEKIKEFYGK